MKPGTWDALRSLLLIGLALALTGAAGRWWTAPALATEGEASPAEDTAPGVEDVSDADLEAEIREMERAIQEATGSQPSRDPGEIAADKPLSADTAISLPSDI